MSENTATKRRVVLDLLGLRHAETKPDLLPAAEYALVERGWGADNIGNPIARNVLAAVLPEIQAQALRDAADRLHARTDGVNREGTKGWPERNREVYAHAIDEASDALREDAARLTDTTEGAPRG